MTKRQEIFFRQIIGVSDVLTLLVSYVLAYWIRGYFLGSWYGALYPFPEYLWILWVIVPTWIFLLHRRGLYQSASYQSLGGLLSSLLQVQILGGLVLLSVMYLSKSLGVSRLLLQIFLGVSSLGLVAQKVGVKVILDRFRRRPHQQLRNVLVVGTNARTEKYLELLSTHPHWGARVIGFLSADGGGNSQFCDKPILGRLVDFSKVVQEQVIDEVVVGWFWEDSVVMEEMAAICAERGVTFRILMEMPPIHMGSYHVEELERGQYLLSLETVPQKPFPLLIKRVLDAVGAIVGLMLCGVVYLWYRPKIRRESPGPVFFRQTRVGQNGRLFILYKFRTMHSDAEERLKDLWASNEMQGHIFKIKDDPRVTPTGHVLRGRHLDELPQFWNVLCGDLSLVGTRPPTPNEVSQYESRHHRRLSMKPGITGLWQSNGHVVNDFEEVVRLDCKYIDNWSLWLDCKILAKTMVKVVKGEGW